MRAKAPLLALAACLAAAAAGAQDKGWTANEWVNCDGRGDLGQWVDNGRDWAATADKWTITGPDNSWVNAQAVANMAAGVDKGGWWQVDSLWSAGNAISADMLVGAWTERWTALDNAWNSVADSEARFLNGTWAQIGNEWMRLGKAYKGQVGGNWVERDGTWQERAERFEGWRAGGNSAQGLTWAWNAAKGGWSVVNGGWSTGDWATQANAALWARWVDVNGKVDHHWLTAENKWARLLETTDAAATGGEWTSDWNNLEAKWTGLRDNWVDNGVSWAGDEKAWAGRSIVWQRSGDGWRKTAMDWQTTNVGGLTESQKLAGAWWAANNVWNAVGNGLWNLSNAFWTNAASRKVIQETTWTSLCPIETDVSSGPQ